MGNHRDQTRNPLVGHFWTPIVGHFWMPIDRLKVSSQKKLNAEELAGAICKVTTDIEIQKAATVLGKKIQSEDGVVNAINTIENIMTESKKDLLQLNRASK